MVAAKATPENSVASVLLPAPNALMPVPYGTGTLGLPCRLSLKRYTHGEWRLSCAPTHEVKRKRIVQIGRVNDSWAIQTNSNAYNRHRPEKPAAKNYKTMQLRYTNTLDHRLEVQGIYKRGAKKWNLPMPKHFRPSGRIRIQECALIAERLYAKNAIFGTLTIPGSGWRIAAVIAAYSGKIVNRVKQWFRDNLTDTYAFFSVWEWQQRGMLHLHFCVASNQIEKLEKLRQSVKTRWIQLLQDISWDAKIDVFRKSANWTWQDNLQTVQTDVVWVTKSIGRYLSKYAAKCTNVLTRPRFFCPSRWWSTDRKTQQQADKERVRITLQGMTGSVGMQILESLGTLLLSEKAHIKPFRNFCYQSYGGINLFEDSENLTTLIMQFCQDNFGAWIEQKGDTCDYEQ